MIDEVHTTSIGRGIADVNKDYILQEEPMARLVFRPQIHNGGIRGRIIRQRRRERDDVWSDDERIDIRTLEKGENFNVEIKTEAVVRLDEALQELKQLLSEQGVQFGSNSFQIVDSDALVITDENKAEIFKKIIDGGYGDDFWVELASAEPITASGIASGRIIDEKRGVIADLQQRLIPSNISQYHETNGDDSWQNFILDNNWLFGANYLEPIDKTKINIAGSMPDFIYPSADGYADILEIKLPTENVVLQDASHVGSWRWCGETNKAIGQVTNYIVDIERNILEVEKQVRSNYGIEISFLKPRAFILIGNSEGWEQDKKDGMRKLNSVLHGIEVITYAELVSRGINMLHDKNN